MTLFRIRVGLPADLPALREVFRSASLYNQGDVAALLAHPESLLFTGEGIAEGRTRVAIWTGDHIVGFATTLRVGGVLELEDLFVHPDWMNRGIGRRLVRDSVSIALQHHLQCVAVTANPHALGFYENVGFVYADEVKTRYGPGVRMHLDVAAENGNWAAGRS